MMGRVALDARMLAAAASPANYRNYRLPVVKTLYAVCDRRGVIEMLESVPEGMIGIIAGTPNRVREIMSATARHAYDGKTLLVPGVPEAEDDDRALEALIAFRHWIAQRHPRMVRAAG